MSTVIFDITRPPIGEVEILLNNHERVDVSGLEGIVSLGSGTERYAFVTFSRKERYDIPEDLGEFRVNKGKGTLVALTVGEQTIEGSLRLI